MCGTTARPARRVSASRARQAPQARVCASRMSAPGASAGLSRLPSSACSASISKKVGACRRDDDIVTIAPPRNGFCPEREVPRDHMGEPRVGRAVVQGQDRRAMYRRERLQQRVLGHAAARQQDAGQRQIELARAGLRGERVGLRQVPGLDQNAREDRVGRARLDRMGKRQVLRKAQPRRPGRAAVAFPAAPQAGWRLVLRVDRCHRRPCAATTQSCTRAHSAIVVNGRLTRRPGHGSPGGQASVATRLRTASAKRSNR